MDLNTIWFLLVAVLLVGYAILDGFDFGVGILHLFAKNDLERRIHLNAIGPVWDGNEVWLLTGGGALFAAFPIVYATVFSGFYIALMLLLAALIFRAVSMEFRGKVDGPGWKSLWDYAFAVGSLLPALLFGVAFGNILRGVPIDGAGNYLGTFFGLLNPYALIVGIFGLAVFTMHGANYMLMKTDGLLYIRIQRAVAKLWIAVVVLYFVTTVATIFLAPHLLDGVMKNPLFWILLLVLIASIIFIPIAARGDKPFRAFLGSSLLILSLMGLASVSLFPRLVPSSINLEYSLTIYNASSSHTTLTTMLVIALIGMPLVIGYTAYIYRVFKGKVVIGKESY